MKIVKFFCVSLFIGVSLFLAQCGGGADGTVENIEYLLTAGEFSKAISLAEEQVNKLAGTNDPHLRIFQRQLASALIAKAVVETDASGKATGTLIGFLADWAEYDEKTGTTLQKIYQVLPSGLTEHKDDLSRAREILEGIDKSSLDDEAKRAYVLLGSARLMEIGAVFYGPDEKCDCASCSIKDQNIDGGDGRPDGGVSVTDAQISQFDEDVSTAADDFEKGGIDPGFLSDLSDALNEIENDISNIPAATRTAAIRIYLETQQFANSINPDCPD